MTGRDLFMFVLGGGFGAALTYFCMRDRVQKELEILHEDYKQEKKEEPKQEEKKDSYKPDDKDILETAKILAKERYDYESDPDLKVEVPHLIRADDFNTLDGYDIKCCTYYADGVVTDDNDEPIDEPEKILGTDYIEPLKQGTADLVFVRNDILETDYEISRSIDPYEYDMEGLDDPGYEDDEEDDEY